VTKPVRGKISIPLSPPPAPAVKFNMVYPPREVLALFAKASQHGG